MSNNGIGAEYSTVEYSYFIGGGVTIPQSVTDVGGVVSYTGLDKLYTYAENVRKVLIDEVAVHLSILSE